MLQVGLVKVFPATKAQAGQVIWSLSVAADYIPVRKNSAGMLGL